MRAHETELKNRCIDRWGKRAALSLEPLEIEQWLKALKREEGLTNPTLDKIRRVMSLVYKHGQRYGLIPRTQEANPMRFVRCKTTSSYEAMILTPQQAFAVLTNLDEPERTLTLLAAATGLRISECLGLQWRDVSFEHSQIHVRRTWTCGAIGVPCFHSTPMIASSYNLRGTMKEGGILGDALCGERRPVTPEV